MKAKWARHFDQNGKVTGWVNLEKVESILVKKNNLAKDKFIYIVGAWIDEGCYWLFVSETETEARAWLEKFMEDA